MFRFPLADHDLTDLTPQGVFDEVRNVLDVDFWSGYHLRKVNRPRFELNSDDLWFEYHQLWKDHYSDQMLHEIDPVLRFAARTTYASTWHSLVERFCHNGACRKFLKSAACHDIASGVCMSTRQANGDMQIISFACRQKTGFNTAELAVATYFGQIMGQAISRSRHDASTSGDIEISARALECLELCAVGKSSAEIELILGISRHTVDFHIRNAMTALDTTSRTYAVVRAMQLGLLLPN